MNAQFLRMIVREAVRRQNVVPTDAENHNNALDKYRACTHRRCAFCAAKYDAFRTGQASRFTPKSLRQKIMLDYAYYFQTNDLMSRIPELPLPEMLRKEFHMIVDRLRTWRKIMTAILEQSADCYLYDLHWTDGSTELDLLSTARMMYHNSRITTVKKFRIAAITCDQQSIRTYYDQLDPVTNGSLSNTVCGTVESFPGFFHILMYWFQKCANNDEANHYLKPALYQAIELHWFEIVQYLWPVICSVEEAVPGGIDYVRDHAFHLAVSKDNLLVVRYLWENSHQSETRVSMVSSVTCCGSRNSYHAFLEAVRIGNFDLVHYIFSKSSPSDKHRMLLVDNCFAFIQAATLGSYSIVEYLLDNVQNANEKFMLFYAQHGAAIQRACRSGNLAVVKLLLTHMNDDSMRHQQLTLGDCACLVQLTRYGHPDALHYLWETYESIREVAIDRNTLAHILFSSIVPEFDLNNDSADRMAPLKGFAFWFDNKYVMITSSQLAQCFMARRAYEMNLAFEAMEPIKPEAFCYLVERLDQVDKDSLFGSKMYLRQGEHLAHARQILGLPPLDKPIQSSQQKTVMNNQDKQPGDAVDAPKTEPPLTETIEQIWTTDVNMEMNDNGDDMLPNTSVAAISGNSSNENSHHGPVQRSSDAMVISVAFDEQSPTSNSDGHIPPPNQQLRSRTNSIPSSECGSSTSEILPMEACASAASSAAAVHCSRLAFLSARLGNRATPSRVNPAATAAHCSSRPLSVFLSGDRAGPSRRSTVSADEDRMFEFHEHVEEMFGMQRLRPMDEDDVYSDFINEDEVHGIGQLQRVIRAHTLLSTMVNRTVHQVVDIERRLGTPQTGVAARRHTGRARFYGYDSMAIGMLIRRDCIGERDVSYDRLTVQSQRLVDDTVERVLYVVEHPREDHYQDMRMAELDDLVRVQREARPSGTAGTSGVAGTSRAETVREPPRPDGGDVFENEDEAN